jgi:SAM-dependent methyltransferase
MPDQTKTEAFAGRLFNAALGAADLVGVYLGDRLGLYRALVDGGPFTPRTLARRAGIHARYAREWLEQQAVSGILDVDDPNADEEKRRYSLPAAHAAALTDPNSPFSMAPLARAIVGAMPMMPKILTAYRTGGGVSWSAFGADTIEAQGDFNRPWLLGQLGAEYLPKVPDIHARLSAKPPARVLDVACGVGWASIAIAQAYPSLTVLGLDLDRSSIRLARDNAAQAGLKGRVQFQAQDVAALSRNERFDLAIIVEAVHDMSRPVDVLRAIRRHLAPGGSLIVVDEKVGDRFTVPGDEVERFMYSASLMICSSTAWPTSQPPPRAPSCAAAPLRSTPGGPTSSAWKS